MQAISRVFMGGTSVPMERCLDWAEEMTPPPSVSDSVRPCCSNASLGDAYAGPVVGWCTELGAILHFTLPNHSYP
jgi:hypothetical protein